MKESREDASDKRDTQTLSEEGIIEGRKVIGAYDSRENLTPLTERRIEPIIR